MAEINKDKVRENVDGYIASEGYGVERIPPFKQFGFPGERTIFAQPIVIFGEAGKLGRVKDSFEPISKIYQEGRDLFAVASTLTPQYKELYVHNQQVLKNMDEDFEEDLKTLEGKGRLTTIIGATIIAFYNYRDMRRGKYGKTVPLPPLTSEHEGLEALGELYSWLQTGNIDCGLYNIRNHTSIVCLDQLQQYGLELDGIVSEELERIPRGFLEEVVNCRDRDFVLRENCPNRFGKGLIGWKTLYGKKTLKS